MPEGACKEKKRLARTASRYGSSGIFRGSSLDIQSRQRFGKGRSCIIPRRLGTFVIALLIAREPSHVSQPGHGNHTKNDEERLVVHIVFLGGLRLPPAMILFDQISRSLRLCRNDERFVKKIHNFFIIAEYKFESASGQSGDCFQSASASLFNKIKAN